MYICKPEACADYKFSAAKSFGWFNTQSVMNTGNDLLFKYILPSKE